MAAEFPLRGGSEAPEAPEARTILSEEPVFIDFFLMRWLKRFRQVRARLKLRREERQEQIDEWLNTTRETAIAARKRVNTAASSLRGKR